MTTRARLYRRHAFKIIIIITCIFSGAMQILTHPPSNIAQVLGAGFENIWSWTMLAAGLFALVGVLIHNRYVGFALELGGMLGLATMSMVYGIAVLVAASSPLASFAGPVTVGISLACWSRAWDVATMIHSATRDPDEVVSPRQVREKLVELVEENARATAIEVAAELERGAA